MLCYVCPGPNFIIYQLLGDAEFFSVVLGNVAVLPYIEAILFRLVLGGLIIG